MQFNQVFVILVIELNTNGPTVCKRLKTESIMIGSFGLQLAGIYKIVIDRILVEPSICSRELTFTGYFVCSRETGRCRKTVQIIGIFNPSTYPGYKF